MKNEHTFEQLLEQLGSEEAIDTSEHRYALRRVLLNSRLAPGARPFHDVWSRVAYVGGTVMAGGVAVAVMVVILHFSTADSSTSSGQSAVVLNTTAAPPAEPSQPPSHLLPEVHFAEFADAVPVDHFMNAFNTTANLAVSRR